METDGSAAVGGRPRPWLLVALALAVGLALVSWLMPGNSAAPARRASNVRVPAAKKGVDTVQPADLDVHLEELKATRRMSEAGDRNPFRFYVKPPPPPPPPAPVIKQPVTPPPPPPPGPGQEGYVPPPPPPITIKFIGTAEKGGKKWAIFSDGRGTPVWAAEGETVLGQWRLVRIGVESVVMEYPDGRGRQTIPMRGGTQ
jgi:hypothetical protein